MNRKFKKFNVFVHPSTNVSLVVLDGRASTVIIKQQETPQRMWEYLTSLPFNATRENLWAKEWRPICTSSAIARFTCGVPESVEIYRDISEARIAFDEARHKTRAERRKGKGEVR